MNEKTFRVLEYEKVIDRLREKAESELGKRLVDELKPSTSLEEVERLQEETKEALELLMKTAILPFGIYDISNELKGQKSVEV